MWRPVVAPICLGQINFTTSHPAQLVSSPWETGLLCYSPQMNAAVGGHWPTHFFFILAAKLCELEVLKPGRDFLIRETRECRYRYPLR